jgi:hypothetical protein
MADAPTWDGVPPNPSQTGWHWLQHKKGGPPAPWLWTNESGGPGDFGWATDDDSDPADMAKQFHYVALCVPPSEPGKASGDPP